MQRSDLRIFLCHASQDKTPVREVYQYLKEKGFNPWLDEEDLLAGQDWKLEITKAVRTSHIVIVCLSTNSISKRGYVQKEIRYALDVADEIPEGRIFLIPLKLEECQLPNNLERWHCINYNKTSSKKKLLRALDSALTDMVSQGNKSERSVSKKLKNNSKANTAHVKDAVKPADSTSPDQIPLYDEEIELISQIYRMPKDRIYYVSVSRYDSEHPAADECTYFEPSLTINGKTNKDIVKYFSRLVFFGFVEKKIVNLTSKERYRYKGNYIVSTSKVCYFLTEYGKNYVRANKRAKGRPFIIDKNP